LSSKAFIFFATHFREICNIDIYPNACNYHFQTYLSNESHSNKTNIVYSHRLVEGPSPEKDYGIQLAERIGFPLEVIKAAQSAMDRLRDEFYDVDAITMTKESMIRRLKKQLIQSLRRANSNKQMPQSQKVRILMNLRENYLRATQKIELTVPKTHHPHSERDSTTTPIIPVVDHHPLHNQAKTQVDVC
jgi:DNA mismatch repair ATPase MutS